MLKSCDITMLKMYY